MWTWALTSNQHCDCTCLLRLVLVLKGREVCNIFTTLLLDLEANARSHHDVITHLHHQASLQLACRPSRLSVASVCTTTQLTTKYRTAWVRSSVAYRHFLSLRRSHLLLTACRNDLQHWVGPCCNTWGSLWRLFAVHLLATEAYASSSVDLDACSCDSSE